MNNKQHRHKIINAMWHANITTQQELSRQSGINAQSINTLTTVGSNPMTKAGKWRKPAIDLAKFFNMQPSDLFQDDDEYVDISLCTENLLASNDSPDIEYEKTETKMVITEVMDSLDAKQIKILKMRFWDDKTLEEIGNVLCMTREGVRRCEARALRKLRHPSKLKVLESVCSL